MSYNPHQVRPMFGQVQAGPPDMYSHPGTIWEPVRSPDGTHLTQHQIPDEVGHPPLSLHALPLSQEPLHQSMDYRTSRTPFGPGIPATCNLSPCSGSSPQCFGAIQNPPREQPLPGGPPPREYAGRPASSKPYKTLRAATACDECRAKKRKCDEKRPTCQGCELYDRPCIYRNVPPPKQETLMSEMLEKLDQFKSEILEPLIEMNHKIELQDVTIKNLAQQQLTFKNVVQQEFTSTNLPLQLSEPRPQSQENVPAPVTDQDGTEAGDLSMPIRHTTAAHNILEWEAVQMLLPPKIGPGYVLGGERDRRLIRVYGHGEGFGEDNGGATGSPCGLGSSVSTQQRGNLLTLPPLIPSKGPWGTGCCEASIGGSRQAVPLTLTSEFGDLDPDGPMDLDPRTVRELYSVYLNTIHIVHPFLDKNALRKKVDRFVGRYCPLLLNSNASQKRSLDGTPIQNQVSDAQDDISQQTLVDKSLLEMAIKKTVSNATVLLVLALGKLYQTDDLRESRPTTPSGEQYQPTERQPENSSRVFPGAAYFSFARDALERNRPCDDIGYVQACLLAGLYMGQLAHTFSSHAFITQAGPICEGLIQPANLEKMTPSQQDRISIVFWSCLQLESDLLAELNLPPSGISRHDNVDNVSLPKGLYLDSDPDAQDGDALNLTYYLAQLQLRRTLNRVHTELYKAKNTRLYANVVAQLNTEGEPPFNLVQTLNEELDQWWSKLPEPLSWRSDDPPASAINAARLRAKYYGARYIVNRTLLDCALRLTPISLLKPQPQCQPQGSPSPLLKILDKRIVKSSMLCIQAAMKSTTALDGVEGKLVLTNTWGTARAQFGNVLVLAATYNSPLLSSFIPKQELSHLFDRTITFLSDSSYYSPALKIDSDLLASAKNHLFGNGNP